MAGTGLFALCAFQLFDFISGASYTRADTSVSGSNKCQTLATGLEVHNSTVIASGYHLNNDMLTLPGIANSCGVIPGYVNATADLCRIVLNVTTSSTSSVIVEGWLPTTWNSRLVGTGGGGISGCIDYSTLMYTVSLGFAAFGTNGGHNGSSGYELFINQPEVQNDFGWRGVHTQAVVAKEVVQTYYGDCASKNYYVGCSTGGRQGLTEAMMFPDDFDGILAGSPGVDWYNIVSAYALNARRSGWPAINSSSYVSATQWKAVVDAQIALYDGLDGVQDGIIDQPYLHKFDPILFGCGGVLLNDSVCLSSAQIEGVRAVYQPIMNSTDQPVFPGWGIGTSTASWSENVVNNTAKLPSIITDVFSGLVYNNASWTPDAFSINDLEYAAKLDPGHVETSGTDLSEFYRKGGKLLSYQGGYDQAAPFELNMWYYTAVGATLNMTVEEQQTFYRFIYVNGMYHCAEGPGAWNIGQAGPLIPSLNFPKNNVLLALVNWVENGEAPQSIIGSSLASDGTIVNQRTHCIYPAVSKWDGIGATSLASSWHCESALV